MAFLDQQKQVKKYDKSRMLPTIDDFYLQGQQVLQDASLIAVPKHYRQVQNLIISGMGGSALAGHIVKVLFKDELKIPVEIINSYTFPRYLNYQTLYLLSSFSGSTEEPLSTALPARKRRAKIMGITTGSKLASFLKRNNYPAYIFQPKYNYCRQPRLALGYSLTAHLVLLQKAGVIKLPTKNLKSVFDRLPRYNQKWQQTTRQKNNQAKKVAADLAGKSPVVVASDFLLGNAHVLANQLNENSKTFASYFAIPELNHHLLEGLMFPKSSIKKLHFLFLESPNYTPRIKKRYQVTKKVLNRQKIKHSTFRLPEVSKLEQIYALLIFGSYLSFYLAVLNRIDPSPIPQVDYLKKQLAK